MTDKLVRDLRGLAPLRLKPLSDLLTKAADTIERLTKGLDALAQPSCGKDIECPAHGAVCPYCFPADYAQEILSGPHEPRDSTPGEEPDSV